MVRTKIWYAPFDVGGEENVDSEYCNCQVVDKS